MANYEILNEEGGVFNLRFPDGTTSRYIARTPEAYNKILQGSGYGVDAVPSNMPQDFQAHQIASIPDVGVTQPNEQILQQQIPQINEPLPPLTNIGRADYPSIKEPSPILQAPINAGIYSDDANKLANISFGNKGSQASILAKERQAAKHQIEAIRDIGIAQAEGKRAENEAVQRGLDEIRASDAERETANTAMELRIQERQRKLDEKIIEAESANENRESYWGSMGGAQKVASALGLALSGIGGALMETGSNPGAQMLGEQARDFASRQEAKIAGKEREVGRARQLVGDLIDEKKQKNADYYANEAAAYKKIGFEAAAMADKYKSSEIRANANSLIAEMDAKAAESMDKHMRLVANEEKENAMNIVQLKKMGRDAYMQEAELMLRGQKLKMEDEKEKGKYEIEGMTKTGKTYINEKSFDAIREMKGNTDSFLASMNDLIENRDKYGKEQLDEMGIKMKTLAQDLKFQYAETKGLGAIAEHEAKMLDDIIGDPSSITRQLPKMKQLRDIITKTFEKKARAAGWELNPGTYQGTKMSGEITE